VDVCFTNMTAAYQQLSDERVASPTISVHHVSVYPL